MKGWWTNLVQRLGSLSLDAPSVVFAWMWGLSRELEHKPEAMRFLLFFLATWLTYAGDHLIDVFRGRTPSSQRHEFVARYFSRWRLLWFVLTPVSFFLATHFLPSALVWDGLGLMLAIALYWIILHRLPKGRSRIWFKRLTVATLFTAGVVLGVLHGNSIEPLIPAFLFLWMAALLNLLRITAWEHPEDSTYWSRSTRVFIWILFPLCGLLAIEDPRILALALLLVFLDFTLDHSSLPLDLRRVFLDGALLLLGLVYGLFAMI